MVQTVTPESVAGLLEGFKSADNNLRQQAEAQLT